MALYENILVASFSPVFLLSVQTVNFFLQGRQHNTITCFFGVPIVYVVIYSQ